MKNLKPYIRKINSEGKEVGTYHDLRDAAKSINTKLANWKVQLFIMDAINRQSNAFKYRWELIK